MLGVSKIAMPLAGGDVSDQRSITQSYLSEGFDPRIHYRFVVKQVGRPLEDYDLPYEMVWSVYDALIGEFASVSSPRFTHID